MLFGIGLIFILIVVSGAIAYLGDLIGRRVGKKRISIFGLRPKYTSIVITIASGIMIVSVTIAVILLVFKQARTAFFGIQKMVQELKETEASLSELQVKYDEEEKAYKESMEKLSATLDENKKALDENKKAMESKQAELDDILGAINLKSVELSTLQESSKSLSDNVKTLNGELYVLEKSRKELEQKIQDLNREYADTLGEKYHDMLHGEIVYKKDQALARVTIPGDATEKELENRILLSINNIFKEAISKGAIIEDDAALVFEQQFKSLNTALQNSREDTIVELRSHTNVLKGQPVYITLTIVDNSVIYRKGQILEKAVTEPGMTQERISAMLTEMLARTSAEARLAGMVPDVGDGQVGSIPARRFIEVLREIENSSRARTVELFAVEDTRLSDRLQVDFKVY